MGLSHTAVKGSFLCSFNNTNQSSEFSYSSFSVAGPIGVDSVGQPGHAPPIIKMGGKTPFCPPNNQTRIFVYFYLKKET